MARLNWNECSSATARSNSCCAPSLHDVAKCTFPNFSLLPCRCSCADKFAANASSKPAMMLVLNISLLQAQNYRTVHYLKSAPQCRVQDRTLEHRSCVLVV